MKNLLLILATISLLSFNSCQKKLPEKPNVIFFLADDLGYGDIGCYGNDFIETTHIDQLASEGIRFTDAYAAAPNCSPTRASILTGNYPARLGITQYLPGNKGAQRMQNKKLIQPDLPPGLPLEELTIAEALKANGYATASIGKWHLGDDQYLPENQGFDLNFGGSHHGHHNTMFAPFKALNITNVKDSAYLLFMYL